MEHQKRIVAIIPARGGSTGIPKKNICLIAGKPLIAYTILDAQESKYVTDIYVSTDDPEIATASREYCAKVIDRPKTISGPKASSELALLHALDEIEKQGIHPDLVVFLQCTSPFRSGQDIDKAINKLERQNADSLVSVVPTNRFLWQENDGKAVSINYDYRHRPRRQDMKQYKENGSIYIFKPEILRKYNNRLGGKIVLFVMDRQSMWDIDTLQDVEYCQWKMKRYKLSTLLMGAMVLANFSSSFEALCICM